MLSGLFKLDFYKKLLEVIRTQPKLGKREGELARIPADFFVDEFGIIRKAYYGKNIGDHLPFEDIQL